MIVPVELRDELMKSVEAAARSQGMTFREFVVQAIERAATDSSPSSPRPFVQRVHDFGAHLESPWTILAEIETEDYTSRYSRK